MKLATYMYENGVSCGILTDNGFIDIPANSQQQCSAKYHSIKEILKGDKYARLRHAHEDGNMTGLPCEQCDQLNIGDNPLLYSNRDERRTIGSTSSIKFNLEGEGKDGIDNN